VSKKGETLASDGFQKAKTSVSEKGKFLCLKKGKLGVRQFPNKKKPLASNSVRKRKKPRCPMVSEKQKPWYLKVENPIII